MVSGRWRRLLLRAMLALAPMALCATPHAQQMAATGAEQPDLAAASANASKANRNRTRFIIGLERTVDFQVFALTNPNRVFVDLPDVKLQLPALPSEAPIGLVRSFRGGLSAPGKARVVIDVTGPVVIERSTIEKDGKAVRLVLEMAAAEIADAGAERPPRNDLTRPTGASPGRAGNCSFTSGRSTKTRLGLVRAKT